MPQQPTLGFTNVYYTMWMVHEPVTRTHGMYAYTSNYHEYLQNNAIEYDKAVRKMNERFGKGNWVEDLTLRGSKSFWEDTDKKFIGPVDVFPYGKLQGLEIKTSDDVWQLNRLYEDTKTNPRTRVLARQRLFELNELVRFKGTVYTKHELANVLRTQFQESLRTGHFGIDGEKIQISVQEVGCGSFQGMYGTTFIQTLRDSENRMFKYIGGSPKDINPAWDENYNTVNDTFKTIQATVKHTQYDGVSETHLKRIKVIKA